MKTNMIWLLIMGMILAACSGAVSQEATAVKSFDRPAPPVEYSGKSNPLVGDSVAISTGEAIYKDNCVTCHGETGMGDGPAAGALNPKPQPLAVNQEGLGDDYLFWRIAEGGLRPPFASAMPSWKTVLNEEEIWQVITYLRTIPR